ncbi:MAG: HAMP domain-containing sensor histidine kinase [Eubacteriales bacterium]|nr:HAMP domain-containing sensor histidine kinase [Eubacteriales bacterium]
MMKLRNQAIGAFSLFLMLILGGSALFYFLFAEDYYVAQKKKMMNQAYEQIKQVKLAELTAEGDEIVDLLENESFSIIICDEEFQPLYSSKIRARNSLIRTEIVERQEAYSQEAVAVFREKDTSKPISLRGLVCQDGKNFYIYIYEYTTVIRRSIDYVNNFLKMVLVIALAAGCLFAWFLSGKLLRPLERIRLVSEKLAKGDYSVRIEEKVSSEELSQLTASINQMADKIQKDMNDLNNYNYLLLRQNRDMAEFEENRKKFVRNVTHELKTPLAIISSQVEMLEIEKDEESRAYYFGSIMEEVDKMSGLISDLLHTSFEESVIPNSRMVKGDLSEKIRDLVPKYEIWVKSKGIRCNVSVEEGCFAVFDSTQIELAVNNYVMNACSHTAKGRSILLTLRKEETAIFFSVYNDGAQIPSEDLDQIWNQNYQSRENRHNSDEVGLGLYIVKDVMRLHQGSCGVENRKQGVEFWFRIPNA